MAIAGRWQLHPLHLYLVRTYLGIDDLTLPLESPAFGKTTEQIGQLVQREYATMESLGIVVNDEIEPNLSAALRTMEKPYLWVDSVWFPDLTQDAIWRTVAARTENDRTVLAVQVPGEQHRGGTLTVEIHNGTTPAQALLPTFPPARPGTLPPARVPASSFREPTPEQQESFLKQVEPRRGGSGDRQVEAYRAIGSAQHVRGGQVAANMRSPQGKVSRSAILKWFDNAEPDGRYLDHTVRDRAGEWNYLLTPADARILRGEIENLTHAIRS